jgi:DNA modification methylase
MVNRLILGDNLEILKTIESETIDLVYLDPPFFSNRNCEVIKLKVNGTVADVDENAKFKYKEKFSGI